MVDRDFISALKYRISSIARSEKGVLKHDIQLLLIKLAMASTGQAFV